MGKSTISMVFQWVERRLRWMSRGPLLASMLAAEMFFARRAQR
jgi:hypothetical protein